MREVGLIPAAGAVLGWCRDAVEQEHYLHSAPDPRTRPYCYAVKLGCRERERTLFPAEGAVDA